MLLSSAGIMVWAMSWLFITLDNAIVSKVYLFIL